MYYMKAPFVISTNVDSILEPLIRQDKQIKYTQQHKVYAAASILTSRFYEFDQKVAMKVGKHAFAELLDSLIFWKAAIVAKFRTNRAMHRLSVRLQEEYDNDTRCYICCQEFVEGEAKGPKVSYHDHITGCFISPTHRQCNLERLVSFKVPVFFHNFRGYDAHFIVHEFGKRPDREIKVIVQTMEKYLQFEWEPNMVFRDSLQFLSASLEQLEASLAKEVGRDNFQNNHDMVTNV